MSFSNTFLSPFLKELETQRWDDHRYYHHSLANQSLHFLSAVIFVCSYVLMFYDITLAVMLGWIVAMLLRQLGHFFFEPKSFDQVNNVSHEYKERIKVGYNLRMKVVLLTLWIAVPAIIAVEPTFFGLFESHTSTKGFLDHVAILWLMLAVGAILFRTIQLTLQTKSRSGLVWAVKILTEPYNDIKIYHSSIFKLFKDKSPIRNT